MAASRSGTMEASGLISVSIGRGIVDVGGGPHREKADMDDVWMGQLQPGTDEGMGKVWMG